MEKRTADGGDSRSGLTRREIEAVKEDILSAFHCALPGIVEVFRPETRTADIRPAVRGRHREALPRATPPL